MPPEKVNSSAEERSVPPLGNAELEQMHIRLIALENVVIALLAQATEAQLDMVRDRAASIAPRPGFTPHPLTLGASREMMSLVEQSSHCRPTTDGDS